MLDRPIPCVVDTNVVMRDVLRLARYRRTALRSASQIGAICIFASAHVIEEVDEHLPSFAARQRVPDAIKTWKTYCEVIRFVEVPVNPSDDSRVVALAAEDEDDVPTGTLAVILAPCICLSEDPHLIDVGLASPDWLRLALSSRDVGHASALLNFGGMATLGSGLAVAGTAKGVAQAVRNPIGRLILGGLLSGGYVALRRSERSGWKGPRRIGSAVGRAIGAFLDEVTRAESRRAIGEPIIERALITPGTPTTATDVGRIVSLTDEPLTATEIGRRLINEDEVLGRSLFHEVRTELESSPMYRLATAHRWELATREIT